MSRLLLFSIFSLVLVTLIDGRRLNDHELSSKTRKNVKDKYMKSAHIARQGRPVKELRKSELIRLLNRAENYGPECIASVFKLVQGVIGKPTLCQKTFQTFWTATHIVQFYSFGQHSVNENILDMACEATRDEVLNKKEIAETCEFKRPCPNDPPPRHRPDEYIVADSGDKLMEYYCSPSAKNLMQSFIGESACYFHPEKLMAITNQCNESLLWHQETGCEKQAQVTDCILKKVKRICGDEPAEFLSEVYSIKNRAFARFANRTVCDMPSSKESSQNSTATPCSTGQLSCPSGGCFPESWKCDGFEDCPDGFDERHCEA